MAAVPIEGAQKLFWILYSKTKEVPLSVLLLIFASTIVATLVFLYFALSVLAPIPRPPFPSEKNYITTAKDGSVTPASSLPCWHDNWLAEHRKERDVIDCAGAIDDAEVAMSVVVPAYNEEDRIEVMLEEAVAFLDAEYGREERSEAKENGKANGRANGRAMANGGAGAARGYEILIVDDGSKDKTVDVALAFSRKHNLHDILRICRLKENRGKGGAVTHGFRHVRGAYVVFADADGASKFEDLAKLVAGCNEVADGSNRGVAVGSRSHLVGSEAVVKRSALRNALMHSFHLLLRILTPPATSKIRDTQCGFKLFSRTSLPYIIPYMHAEGWIFDVEMLMLAESAPAGAAVSGKEEKRSGSPGIKVAEVQIGWQEIGGSKLNVMWASLGMAWGLAILRASWGLGIYKRK